MNHHTRTILNRRWRGRSWRKGGRHWRPYRDAHLGRLDRND